jgi:hypothetical protein
MASRTIRIFPSRWYRWTSVVMIVVGLFPLVLGIAEGQWWIVTSAVLQIACGVLLFRVGWLRPLLSLGENVMQWSNSPGGPLSIVRVEEVADFSWQDSFDLRLRLHSGEEREVHLQTASARDLRSLRSTLLLRFGARAATEDAPVACR